MASISTPRASKSSKLTPVASKSTPRAYLIGGRGFHKIFWLSLGVALCLTHGNGSMATWGPLGTIAGLRQQAYEYVLDRLMRSAHRMMWWSAFGLLSSSCCAVQLILNLFNFGCAGFNTYLGPVRPVFLAFTIALNARMWQLALPNIGMPSTPEYYVHGLVASTILAVFLSLLPEITDYRNKLKSSSTSKLTSATTGPLTKAILSLEGVQCVACENAVQGALKGLDKMVTCTIGLEQKEATIMLRCDEAAARDLVVPDVITRLQNVGFDAELHTLHTGELASDSSPVDGDSSPVDAGDSGSGLFSAVAAGLLSSSCCILQLAVNLLATLDLVHIGCTGFNKVLGPWRLHIRALTIAWLSYQWFGSFRPSSCCNGRRGRLLFNTLLCLLLTFLPELLRWSGSTAVAPPTVGAQVLKLKIDGMGCEACETHVRGVMERSSGVISSRADFQKGVAEVEIAENWGFDVEMVLSKLKADGYEAEIATTA